MNIMVCGVAWLELGKETDRQNYISSPLQSEDTENCIIEILVSTALLYPRSLLHTATSLPSKMMETSNFKLIL